MEGYTCPHCNKPTISLGKKYLAGKWANISCNECSGRSCQSPVIMVAMYFLYIWNVMLFGTVAFEKQSLLYVGVLLAIWLVLDWFTLYIPLLRMKKVEPKQTSAARQQAQQTDNTSPEKSD
jgi:hypothetical protein